MSLRDPNGGIWVKKSFESAWPKEYTPAKQKKHMEGTYWKSSSVCISGLKIQSLFLHILGVNIED